MQAVNQTTAPACRTRSALLAASFLFAFLLAAATLFAADTRGLRLKSVEQLAGPGEGSPDFHLLLVAIADYAEWERLATPVNDAMALRDILRERYQFKAATTIELYDKAATYSAILDALQRLRAQADANDSVLIYFAGHGHEDGYWIPHDGGVSDRSRWISSEMIRTHIKDWSARHVLVVSDSCFSGDFLMLSRGGRVSTDGMPATVRQRYARKSRYALSSGGSEPVKDAGVSKVHSVFAHFLVESLRANRNRFLTPSSPDLFGYLHSGLTSNPLGQPQTPRYRQILDAGSAEGEFVFFLADSFCDPALDAAWKTATAEPKEDSSASDDAWLSGKAGSRQIGILITNPTGGRLRIDAGSAYQLDGQTQIRLGEGKHRFILDLPDSERLFGELTVAAIDDDILMTQFGLGEGIFFKRSHIQAALEGRPVRYSVSLQGITGPREVISYIMSLRLVR